MSSYLKQGTLRFVPGFKLQTRWGRTEAAVFALECAGAPLMALVALGGGTLPAAAVGLAMVLAAIGLLFAHLGHPRRAWRAVLNVRHSWISRGTLALGAFGALGLVFLALHLPPLAALEGLRAPVATVLALLAVFVGLYPGLVLSASPAIPFWNSGLLPVWSLAQGAATALLLALALGAGDAVPDGIAPERLGLGLLATVAVLTALYVGAMRRRGAAGAESASWLLRGHPWLFVGAGCGLGLVLPALALGWALAGGGLPALAVAAAARVAGDFAMRRAFLAVGMFDPVI